MGFIPFKIMEGKCYSRTISRITIYNFGRIRFNAALIRRLKCEHAKGIILAYDSDKKVIKAIFEHSIDGKDNIIKVHDLKDNKISKVIQCREFFHFFNISIPKTTTTCKIKHPIVQGTVEFSIGEEE